VPDVNPLADGTQLGKIFLQLSNNALLEYGRGDLYLLVLVVLVFVVQYGLQILLGLDSGRYAFALAERAEAVEGDGEGG